MTEPLSWHEYDNGLVLVAESAPALESAAFTILVPCGSIHDPEPRAGLCEMTCDMLTRGAGSRDAVQFINALDEMGVDSGDGASHSYTTFSGAMLSEQLLPALELFADVLRRPHLPADKLEDSRQVMLQEVFGVADDPPQLMIEELRRIHFPHPYGRPTHGEESTLAEITLDDVQDFFSRNYQPRGVIVGVAGRFDWPALQGEIGRLFGDWKPRELPPVVQTPSRRGYRHLPHPSNQVHLGVAYPDVPYRHPDYYSAYAASSVLGGGMSSRLFCELREKESLCYSVFASHFSNREEGGGFCYAASSPDVAQRALDLILQELQRLTQGVDDDELNRLKARALSGLIMQQESSRARSSNIVYDWYHLGRVRPLAEVTALIRELNSEQVNAFLQRHPPRDLTIVSVGPEPLDVPETTPRLDGPPVPAAM